MTTSRSYKSIPLFLLFSVFFLGCEPESVDVCEPGSESVSGNCIITEQAIDFGSIVGVELPHPNGQRVYQRNGFMLSYDDRLRVPRWVAYNVTREEIEGATFERSHFLVDQEISRAPKTDDYRNSGYDRGHIAPAAEMAWSRESMRDSFRMSNMAPQLPDFNQRVWKSLEVLIQEWAMAYGSLYVASGPILTDSCLEFIASSICVPHRFFKVIIRSTPSRRIEGIGFIMEQTSDGDLRNFVVSIDDVERAAQIDFFYQLPDRLEGYVESRPDLRKWVFPARD